MIGLYIVFNLMLFTVAEYVICYSTEYIRGIKKAKFIYTITTVVLLLTQALCLYNVIKIL